MPPPGGDVIGRRRVDTAHSCVRAVRRRDPFEPQVHDDRRRGLHRQAHLPRRGERHGHRERGHGGVAREGADGSRQCRLRAARAGPLPLPRLARREDRRHRDERAADRRASTRCTAAEYTIGPDHIEIASFIGLGAITERRDHDRELPTRRTSIAVMPVFARLGVQTETNGTEIRVLDGQKLVIEDDIGGAIPKIDDGPWPAFPADLTSIAVAVATQAHGTVMIFEKMFENRLFFIDKLVGLGARIILCDPHRVVVTGPAPLVRRADVEPRHPRRHGDAARRALRRGHVDDRRRAPDRPRSTSGSTSGCAHSARRSSASTASRAAGQRLTPSAASRSPSRRRLRRAP